METMETVNTTAVNLKPAKAPAPVTEPLLILIPQLSAYLDYRLYLKDYYEYRVKTDKGRRPYSYAVFSAAADIKSPSYLKLIIEGKRNLSLDMAEKFARALQFNKQETEEFVKLVLFSQACDAVERNRHFVDLVNIRLLKKMQRGEIAKDNWEKLPNWLSWILVSLVDIKDIKFEPIELLKILGPIATEESLTETVGSLFSSGVLRRNEATGEVVKGKELIPTSQNVPVELVRKLQMDLLYLGLESLFKENPVDREVGALTLALTEEEFNQIKFELRQLKKKIAKDIVAKRVSTKGDRLYQLNLQFFPISTKI